MIGKGGSRGNGTQLGAYLGRHDQEKLCEYLYADKNERVETLEISGSTFPDLGRSLASWEAEAKGTRCKKPLWHAQLSPVHGERLTHVQKLEAVGILEKHLGFTGQPRAIVTHEKDGHEHIHVVWSRIDRQTRTARRDSFSHRKNVAAAREIERRFGLEVVANPEFKNDDKTKSRRQRREESRKAPDYREFQKSKRSGLDPLERKETITRLWQESDSGKALRAALQDAGYILARGNSRSFVIVDEAGDTNAVVVHRQTMTEGVSADVVQRHERFELLCSFYGPNAGENTSRLREGVYVAQNREALQLAGMGLIKVGEILNLSTLINAQWYRRLDVIVYIARNVTRVYPVLDLLSSSGTIYSDLSGAQNWSTANVKGS